GISGILLPAWSYDSCQGKTDRNHNAESTSPCPTPTDHRSNLGMKIVFSNQLGGWVLVGYPSKYGVIHKSAAKNGYAKQNQEKRDQPFHF
ncbi:MAG TPA: hypothetical protein PKE43_05490, partial [Anaerolineales bacterium]|nr:hypothetical protein [Anaerolineales bacterium]HND91369.1 hypothetical protein [Anaerolineales bacterium]HNH03762.1 hypothetical protein [Anaerolineales bacterium]